MSPTGSRKRSSDGFKKKQGTPSRVKYASPSKRSFPDLSETDRKLAESDAYLRQIQQKQLKLLMDKERKPVSKMEKDMELSQISSWTGESVFNVKTTAALKKKQR